MITFSSAFTAFVALIGAFGGAYLNNRFMNKRWEKQVGYEREKEERNLMRAKGEETYKLLRKWEKELFIYHSSRIAYLQGNILKHDMDKNISEKVSASTHGELGVLIDLYFSEFSSELEAIHKQVSKANSIYFNAEDKPFALAESQKMAAECSVYERLLEHFFRKLKVRLKSI